MTELTRIPRTELIKELLSFADNRESFTNMDAIEYLLAKFDKTEERYIIKEGSSVNTHCAQIRFTIFDFRKLGLFTTLKKGVFSISDAGREILNGGDFTNLYYRAPEGIIEDAKIREEIREEIKEESEFIGKIFAKTKFIGNGEQAVYVYCNPDSRELAALKGEKYFPVKIGLHNNKEKPSIFSRITAQNVKTAFHCPPEILFVFYTDNCKVLENTLHDIYKLRSRMIDEGMGTEWVFSNPEEIERTYTNIFSFS